MAKVLLYGILEEMTGTSELSMAGSRVLDVLMSLCSLYGAEFREIVFGSDAVFSGSVLNNAIVLLNNAPVRYNVLEAPLAEGDVLSLMPIFEDE